ncbi:MAG: class I SAM-dependent methyltransferase [Vulcanimicrobiaceae bacterium]
MLNAGEDFRSFIERQVAAQPYFFHKMHLWDDFYTPGWSDVEREKLPYYGLPERMDGMRVLDIGCAEGFFSFEAERRGAAQVVAIDSFEGSIERFNLVRLALGSKVNAYLCNVYDLSPKTFGTFDLVMFFGVLYHVKHPWYALEKISAVCSGALLLQTLVTEEPAYRDLSLSWFHPFGIESGPPENRQLDPTVFWVPTPECTRNLVRAAGFTDVEDVTAEAGKPYVLRARSGSVAPGKAPDPMTAPWS